MWFVFVGCLAPIVNLSLKSSSIENPLNFTRSQDIHINSTTELLCQASLKIISNWTIVNCNDQCSSPIPLHLSIYSTKSEIFVPARVLPYGTFRINLTVTMFDFPMLTTSAVAYVNIIQSDLLANLVLFGTSMITQNYQKNLTLDPGVFSIDPDTDVFDSTVS